MIDRRALTTRHDVRLTGWDVSSPLTVGNGETAFTADITGMQTFYEEYKDRGCPLCTMSQWGWHTEPAGEDRDTYYSLSQAEKTEYECNGRTVYYTVEEKPGNEEVYRWLRHNPHRLNLGRIGFSWQGGNLCPDEINQINQVLRLYEGVLTSSFAVKGLMVHVVTAMAQEEDTVAFSIRSDSLKAGKLAVSISFPYGSTDITASDWEKETAHNTEVIKTGSEGGLYRMLIKRTLDRDGYYVLLTGEESEGAIRIRWTGTHTFELSTDSDALKFTVRFIEKTAAAKQQTVSWPAGKERVEAVLADSRAHWKKFWETTGIVDLHHSRDKRAIELERRIVLSKYLLAVQCCGSLPPQETGLTVNSWYGKFHLEMYLLHCGYLPFYRQSETLKKSLSWYKDHLTEARKNAAANNYQGARWPKMVAYDAIDSPSRIATLLVWQQPHIIYLLESVYLNGESDAFLKEYWDVVRETADFMCDFVVYNKQTDRYDLSAPLIPAQEEHDPVSVKNPTFELEYFYSTLRIAALWAERLRKGREREEAEPFEQASEKYRKMASSLAVLPRRDGLYLAHENCPDTFERFNRDHPSMVFACGFLPGERVNVANMDCTFRKVLECWDEATLWGWDFAMMAMTAVRLHDPKTAVDVLLKDTLKNTYAANGNNVQKSRTDLPVYLPGNGSLLLATAMMTAGYEGCKETLPGFPKDGTWSVEYENISPLPY